MNNSSSPGSSSSAQESSVLFSLDEILRLENERILAEEQQRLSEVRKEEERRAAAARAEQESEARRLQDLDEARKAKELNRREEAAKLEGVRLSEIEKVRSEAELQARMSLLAQNQRHEERLAALQQDRSKKLLSRTLFGMVLLGMIGAGVTYYQAEKQGQRAELERLALEREAQQLREQISQQEARIAQEQGRHGQKNQELILRLKADLKALQQAPSHRGSTEPASSPPQVPPRSTNHQSGKKPESPKEPPEPPCPKGDPMCSKL